MEVLLWCLLPLHRLPRKLLPRTQPSMRMRKCQQQRLFWRIAMMTAGCGDGQNQLVPVTRTVRIRWLASSTSIAVCVCICMCLLCDSSEVA